MEGIGEILRDARERKDVTFEQIEEFTKISKRYLQALEREEWERLPGKVYAKGFLRTYARFLGLDEQSLSDLYEISLLVRDTGKGEAAVLTQQKRQKIKMPKRSREVDLHNRPKRGMIFVLCFFSVAVLAFFVWAYQIYYLDESEADKSTPPPIVQTPPENPPPAISTPEPDPEPEPVVYTSITITMEATENCWLRMRDNGEQVYEDTLRPGQSVTFSDLENIELRIGNAGGLIVTLNDIVLLPLGTSGQVITKLYSFRDGLVYDDDSGEALSDAEATIADG